MFKARHSVLLVIISVLTIAVPACADTIVGSTFVPLSVNGSLTFDWQRNINSSGTWYQNQSLSIILTPPPLPNGAAITNAWLQIVFDPAGSAPVNVTRTEIDYTYQSGQVPIYQWVCFQRNWLGNCVSGGNVIVGYNPVYSTGYGGNASFGATYYTSVNSISTVSNTVPVCCAGNYDLLAMGFGTDLIAGNPFLIDATAFLGIQYGISDYGYVASTTYGASATHNSEIMGILTLDYHTPNVAGETAPVPEPASLALLGMGLTIIGRRLKKSN